MVWQLCLVIGWLIRWNGWPSLVDWSMLVMAVVWLGVMSLLYKRLAVTGIREGVVTAVQIVGVFGWLAGVQVGQLAWQGQLSIVELVGASLGLLVGLGLLVYRIWQPSSVIRLQV